MFELPPHTGHGRVWTETLPRLGQLTNVVVGDLHPDVWIMDGHNGDPGLAGPVVMCVYEVNWGTPELDRDHAAGFVERIAAATEEAVRRADHIVTGATSSKHQIVETYGFPADRVHVVPFGVDTTVFNPTRASEGRRLVRDRIPEDRPYVMCPASLHPRKNLAAVRDAVEGLARQGFPHVLVITAGPAPDRADSSDLEPAATAELPGFPGRIVRFVHPSDRELSALMAGADAVCSPSTSEGFGLTVVEAMAAGAPVIVSGRGSLPEVVHRGGLVVEPTAQEVHKALAEVITNPCASKRLRKRAVRRARDLSWEKTACGWLRVATLAASHGTAHHPIERSG